jgi:hypothetical protein
MKQGQSYKKIADLVVTQGSRPEKLYECPINAACDHDKINYATVGMYNLWLSLIIDIARSLRSIDRKLTKPKRKKK